MSDKKTLDPKLDIEAALREAELAAMEYESQIQTGEADELDPVAIERRKQGRERQKTILKETSDWEQVLSTVEGRRVIYRILSLMGPNRISFTPGDPYLTAFNEGQRFAANEVIQRVLAADPTAYHRMQREHVSDLKSELERKKREAEAAKRKEN